MPGHTDHPTSTRTATPEPSSDHGFITVAELRATAMTGINKVAKRQAKLEQRRAGSATPSPARLARSVSVEGHCETNPEKKKKKKEGKNISRHDRDRDQTPPQQQSANTPSVRMSIEHSRSLHDSNTLGTVPRKRKKINTPLEATTPVIKAAVKEKKATLRTRTKSPAASPHPLSTALPPSHALQDQETAQEDSSPARQTDSLSWTQLLTRIIRIILIPVVIVAMILLCAGTDQQITKYKPVDRLITATHITASAFEDLRYTRTWKAKGFETACRTVEASAELLRSPDRNVVIRQARNEEGVALTLEGGGQYGIGRELGGLGLALTMNLLNMTRILDTLADEFLTLTYRAAYHAEQIEKSAVRSQSCREPPHRIRTALFRILRISSPTSSPIPDPHDAVLKRHLAELDFTLSTFFNIPSSSITIKLEAHATSRLTDLTAWTNVAQVKSLTPPRPKKAPVSRSCRCQALGAEEEKNHGNGERGECPWAGMLPQTDQMVGWTRLRKSSRSFKIYTPATAAILQGRHEGCSYQTRPYTGSHRWRTVALDLGSVPREKSFVPYRDNIYRLYGRGMHMLKRLEPKIDLAAAPEEDVGEQRSDGSARGKFDCY
ncbi:unnamed protein product [Zymoseptoria tritici ST99CH_1A5]|uniref:Uncharacterized protein n=1 Tax=Zymoseptoria tritici ST99CH_1A5 TaxID=1276529 RepID=A0A1Y6M1P0_ZYMTR|nr:unnamed protein product [Zymoseptoria tritici ST99CH_1A5]